MKISKKDKKRLEQEASIYKAVAHPIRLAILRCFNACDCSKLTVKHIYQQLGIEQPVASHHLGILKRSGVLDREQKGVDTYYCVANEDPCVNSIIQLLNY